MTKQRRLTDLFVVGKEVTVDDGKGKPIKIWLQKLNPVEHETAMRRASGVRAKVLTGRHAEETEMAEDEVSQFGFDELVEYLASDALGKKIGALEAELADEEEWSKDDYLQGLKDVWVASMEELLREEPEDPSALRVRDELERFRVQLETRIEQEREVLVKDYKTKDPEDLERRAVDRLLQTRADLAWLTEFRKCEVWLATREATNHNKKYFTGREEVDLLTQEVLIQLMTAYQELGVEPLEGKDSRATPDSSSSSESPEPEETAEASGPVAAGV